MPARKVDAAVTSPRGMRQVIVMTAATLSMIAMMAELRSMGGFGISLTVSLMAVA